MNTLKKKIIFAITKSNFGGAQRYVYDLATSLPKEEFDILVIAGDGGELETRLNEAGIRTLRINSLQRDVSILKDLKVLLELIKIFKKEKPDIVHLNSTKIGGVGALAGRICGIHKIIFTAHGWAFNEKRSIISKNIILLLQWLTVIFSHKTIAVSQTTANQILKLPLIKKNKIKIIYNGISNIDFIDRDDARKIFSDKININFSEKTLLIGTISELHTNKGIDFSLKAFADIAKINKNVFYLVIGSGDERDNLSKQIIDLGITNQAFLIGQIPDAKKYLKAFDIFTLTSRTEALPYAILEAGLAELPIIASAVGGIPEITSSLRDGILVKPKNIIQETRDALEYLIGDEKERVNLGKNIKEKILEKFSKEQMITETSSLYY